MEAEELFTVVTVGDSGVGKSSLIIRASEGKFFEDVPSLSVLDFKKVHVEVKVPSPKKITLKLVDTAG